MKENKDLKKLPLKIKLMTKRVSKVVDLLDQAFKHDGNFRGLANDHLSAILMAEENKQRGISDKRLSQSSVTLLVHKKRRKSMVEQVPLLDHVVKYNFKMLFHG